MKQGLLLVVSGPSAVGKNTVLNAFLARYSRARYSISATTRPPRPGEVHGRNYYFYSEAEFRRQVAAGAFLEWAEVYGALYGTPLAPIEEALTRGEVIVLDIDIQGAAQIRKRKPEAVFVFLLPPSLAALAERIRARGAESGEAMAQRLAAAQAEISRAKEYDYLIVNRDAATAAAELVTVVEAESLRTERNREILAALLEEKTQAVF